MDDDEVLLNAQQTRAHVGSVSAMCIWRWIRDERVKFPPPTKIVGRRIRGTILPMMRYYP